MKERPLSILMVTHHRKFKMYNRPFPMSEYLAKRGHDVTLLVTADTNRMSIQTEVINNVTIVEIPDLLWGRLRSGWDLWNGFRKLLYLLQNERKFDIIHVHETRPATILSVLPFARWKKIPLVIDWNDWWGGEGGVIDEIRPWWYRWTFGWVEAFFEEYFRKFADGTTAISNALKDRAIGLGISPESILQLPGGAKSDKYPFVAKEQCRVETGLPKNGPILGFSSLDSHLDMDLVFEALQHIVERKPTCKLIITGSANSRVQQLADRFGVGGSVIWTGFVPSEEFMVYLGCCDLFLMPLADKMYNRGRWPNKITDYITVGRPVLANPIGDMADLVERFDIGILTGWDSVQFANAAINLLDNYDLLSRMGQNARCLAEGEFSWSNLVARLERFYRQVLNDYRGPSM